ncbi:hypothetical protein GEV33_003966 [Tenebrio molitor]|uniref:Uncharacterized protein n=1 Tax=Tenebrio molitor TaxID=7067 RepID=A0A8J6LEU1_TENMO|nr:hypothetical protein GEV33_003966 [Tenebrio molitor]
MHSPPTVSAEGDHQCQRESATAPVQMFLQHLGTSQPFIKQTYDLVHLIATTGHPYKIHPINAKGVPPGPSPVLRNYTMLRLPKPDITQLPKHLLTLSLSPTIASLIHCITLEATLALTPCTLDSSIRFTVAKRHCLASPVLKITPKSRTFSNIILIYEPHVWLEEVVPELAPQRKQTNADDNLDPKNANEEQLMACIREL